MERSHPRRRGRRGRSASKASCATATARRCPTRCSSCGRPTRRAATRIRTTSAPCRATGSSAASAARAPTPTGAIGSAPIVPGAVAGANGVVQAPHANLTVFARGLLKRLVTRIYFADREERERARSAAGVDRGRRRARDADRAARRAARRAGGVPVRHRAAGRGRNRVPGDLSARARSRAAGDLRRPVRHRARCARSFSRARRLRAMLAVEVALARAQAGSA